MASKKEVMIVNRRSKKALQATGLDNGQVVEQAAATGADNQLWTIVEAEGGVKLFNKANGKVLDVMQGGTADGTWAQTWEDVGGESQLWTVENVTPTYKKLIHVLSGKALDIVDMSDEDGAPAQIWESVDGEGQQWKLTAAQTDDHIKIKAQAPLGRKCLCVRYGASAGQTKQITLCMQTLQRFTRLRQKFSLIVDQGAVMIGNDQFKLLFCNDHLNSPLFLICCMNRPSATMSVAQRLADQDDLILSAQRLVPENGKTTADPLRTLTVITAIRSKCAGRLHAQPARIERGRHISGPIDRLFQIRCHLVFADDKIHFFMSVNDRCDTVAGAVDIDDLPLFGDGIDR